MIWDLGSSDTRQKVRISKMYSLKVSYWFVNLKLFHLEWRNFDQNDMIFLDTGVKKFVFDIRDSSFFNLAHA